MTNMKRRKFLKSIALTGATGLVLPGINLLASDGPVNRINPSPAPEGFLEQGRD